MNILLSKTKTCYFFHFFAESLDLISRQESNDNRLEQKLKAIAGLGPSIINFTSYPTSKVFKLLLLMPHF